MESVKHVTSDEAKAAFVQSVRDASENHRWMAALWHIDNDGKIKLNRTTWDFPVGDFVNALNDLRKDLQNESRIASNPDPLSEAKVEVEA